MKYARLAKVTTLALAVVFLVPTSIGLISGSDEKPQPNNAMYVRIYVPGADAQSLAAYGVEIIERYDGFVLAKADTVQVNTMKSSGMDVEDASDLFKISLRTAVFDVRDGEPGIPESLRIAAYPAKMEGYYLVHFIGPVKEQWKWALEARGAEVLRYIPNDAFIVRMTPESRDSVDQLREVVWSGIYHPAYRIDPSLYGASGLVPVEIITFGGSPVTSVVAYLNQLGYGKATFGMGDEGVVRYYQGSDFGVVKARIDASLIPAVALLKNVEYVAPYDEPTLDNFNAQYVHQTDNGDPMSIDARRIWDMGIRGQGQITATADSGLDFDHNMFRQSTSVIQNGDIYNVTDTDRRKLIRYLPMSNYTNVDPWTEEWAIKDSSVNTGPCTSGHGTATAGIVDGNDDPMFGPGLSSLNDGMAKDAKHFFQDIGTVGPSQRCSGGLDDLLSYIPDDLNLLFGPAYGAGARVHSNSWGGGTNAYALSSRQIDEFMWKHPDMLVAFAEGNGGPTLGSLSSQPAAKNLLAAGGAFNYPSENGMTTYNAWGPTLDGRQRPTVSFASEGVTSWSDGDPFSNVLTAEEWVTPFGGTSYAAPDSAGQATLVRQYFTDGWYPTGAPDAANGFNPQASLTLATLAASSVKMTGARTNPAAENRFPNDAQGWGRPLLDNALYFAGDSRNLVVHDDTSGLATGQWEEYRYNVVNGSQILKIIVAWTDYPGTVGAGKALVNDLDIVVTAPNSDTYRGNVWQTFAQGQSRPNFGSNDHLNNMEGVIVNTPLTGVWTLRVTGYDIPAGPQPYSIAVVGGLGPDYGQVFLDRHSYTEADTVQITVVDTDAVGTVAVNVSSDTEPDPWFEMLFLTETGTGTGVFTGSIDTAFGTPLPNGIIEVSEGDTVWVKYSDSSPVHDEYAHAVINTIKATIYNVQVFGITSSTATISWLTNIPTDSSVFYDPVPPPAMLRSAPELKISHSITLVNLATATLYYFDVASSDRRGHSTIDTNGGTHYSFKTTAMGEILLVLGDETYEQNRPEGVQAYRQSLADKGWAYNEWHVAYSGDPSLALMQTYKAVIWQVGLEQYPPHTDLQIQLLNNYLDGGGRLFYVHHDTFWAYCAATSSWFDPGRCFWVQGILKASFNEGNPNAGDPQQITSVVGESGDPISGDYALGGPQYPTSYVPFRAGGAADEVSSVAAGGVTSFVWSDAGGDATPDKISVKWASTSPNGTLGVGVWGGYVSKFVGFYANWIDINYLPGITLDTDRTDILDKTIIWLLDRDHPDVQISAPNGGEIFTSNTIIIFWNKTTFGTNVFGQSVYYSPNAGQSWFPVVWNLAPADVSYVWSVTGVCNADEYLVRVDVQDDGAPMFNASDDSDFMFQIQRVGGDCGGPIVWAGSVYVNPNPIMGPVTAYINATVDDSTRGNSNIDATAPAEFFFDVIGADGTGWTMNLTPPATPVEDVFWTGQLDWLSHNCHVLFVHGQDELGSWGPFENVTFCVQDVPPARPPRPATNINARLENGGNDVNITWSPSPDDPAALDNYTIWVSPNLYDRTKGPSYSMAGNVSPGTLYWLHTGVGRDANSYFYYVRAVNAGGFTSTVDQAAKFARNFLTAGEYLVSTPLQSTDMSVLTVFQTLNFDSLRMFNPLDAQDPWKSYVPGRAYNDFSTVTTGKGLWVHVVSPGIFAVAGRVPQTTTITVYAGWNLVGFPSFMPYTLGDLKAAMPGNVRAFETFDATAGPYYLQKVTSDSFALAAGNAYWVWAGSTANYVLSN